MATTQRVDEGGGRPSRGFVLRLRSWWRNIPVRRKVLAVPFVALVLSTPSVVYATVLENRHDDARAESQATQELLDDVNALVDEIVASDEAGLMYSISVFEDEQFVEDIRQAVAEARRLEERIARSLPADLDPHMQELSRTLGIHLDAVEGVAELGPGDAGEEPELSRPMLDVFAGAIDAAADARRVASDLRDEVDERLSAQRRETADLAARVGRAVFASWVVVFATVAGGAAIVTTNVLRRVQRLDENGRRFLAGEALLPLKQSDDEIGQLIGGMTSVGEVLAQRREEAIDATRMRDEFLSRISHELRTPLAAIMERGEVLERTDLSSQERKAARHVVTGGEHLLSLIDDLLDISRIETGDLAVSVEPVVLHEIVEDTVALVRPRATDRDITIGTDIPHGLIVAADPRRLRQVLLNLLTNAVKFNRPAGRVDLTASVLDGTVRIDVADTGSGISQEGLVRLFQPFERLDAARRGIAGSGIGLALAKNLVEAMGGAVHVDSEVDRGSTFRVLLPTPSGLPDPGTAAELSDPPDAPGPLLTAPPTTPDTEPPGEQGVTPEEHDAGAATGALPSQGTARRNRRGRHERSRSGNLRTRWDDMQVRRKVLAVVAAALVVSLPAIVLAVTLELRLADVSTDRQSTQELLDDLNNLQDRSLDATDAVLLFGISLYQDDELYDDFQRAADDALEIVARLDPDVPEALDQEMREVTAAVEEQVESLSEVVEVGVDLAAQADDPAAELDVGIDITQDIDVLLQTLVTAGTQEVETRQATGNLRAGLDARLAAQRADVENLESLVTWAVIGSWIVTVLAIAGGTALLIVDMVQRVERLTENGRRFVAGEALLPLKQSDDEIGQLIARMISVAAMIDQGRREAVDATRMRDEFLSRISHELRTPLTAIIGFGEILEDGAPTPEGRDAAAAIVKGGENMLCLIDDLLDLSKTETGHLPISIDAVPLHEVAGQAVALVLPRAATRFITIDAGIPHDLVVAADRERLQQVVVNLLGYAITYAQDSGTVAVAASSQGAVVQMDITDAGLWVSPEDLERIFVPFEHLDATHESESSGIELALAKNLVEAMGGTVTAESEAGRGTTFEVRLPVATGWQPTAKSSLPAPGAVAPAWGNGDGTRPLVLYADAGSIDIARIQATFHDRDERLQIVPDGRSVPGIARLLRPALILLAADLPDIDIETLLRQLGSSPDTALVPVIVLTAHPSRDHADLLMARGAEAVLPRPVNTAQLTKALDSS